MSRPIVRRVVAATALLLLQSGAYAQEWWSDDWAFRKEIGFDLSPTAGDVAENQTDVPVLIRLSVGNFAFFDDAKPDGSDLRFIASDGVTPLEFHIERYDAQYQLALIWVRVPLLTGGANTDRIQMYYGNPEAVSASNPEAVYDPEQTLLIQFTEPDAAGDRTAYANDATTNTTTIIEGGLIAGAAAFDVETVLEIPSSATLAVSSESGFTLSAWLRLAEATTAEAAFVALDDPITGDRIEVAVDGDVPSLRAIVNSVVSEATATATLTPGSWHHVAVRGDADSLDLLIDGFPTATLPVTDLDYAAAVRVGATPLNPLGVAGEVDQLEFSTVARADDRIRFAARSEAAFSTLVVYGADNSNDAGGGGESYFATTLRNVTVDGWVVIVILMIMAVISWIVMYLKGQLLTRIERQNARFLAEYSKLVGDPLALDRDVPELDAMEEESLLSSALEDPESYHPSTLFPLYHVGSVEVKKRIARQSPAVGAAASGFTAQTIGAIGASIDAALVRQRQKLNRLMVLLTIAISGGPFLGLLGTVIGVMITFAAIAASGDVNVNSIAPGIAAALVATVAGLVVAIPALFGYNWLGSRIKDIDANTQVFADEFINKIAEHYN